MECGANCLQAKRWTGIIFPEQSVEAHKHPWTVSEWDHPDRAVDPSATKLWLPSGAVRGRDHLLSTSTTTLRPSPYLQTKLWQLLMMADAFGS